MNAIDLYRLLTPHEQEQLQKLMHRPACDRVGHRFKIIGQEYRWFRSPALKLICTACGQAVHR